MSDDDEKLNQGVTLPEGRNATHNIGFSPFFINHDGYIDTNALRYYARGADFIMWSPIARISTIAYYIEVSTQIVYPTRYWNIGNLNRQAFSLRCLVSTNNR